MFLSSAQGIEGQYIQYAPDYAPEDVASRLRGATFTVDPALGKCRLVMSIGPLEPVLKVRLFFPWPSDPSLSDLVERILPLATYFTSIYAFIETDSSLEYGTVTHALCAAIRDLLKVGFPKPCEAGKDSRADQ